MDPVPNLSIIVACDINNGIARKGIIPWRSPRDLEHFRRITTGNGNNIVVMGRKTFETIPHKYRPLNNRINCVITSKYNDIEYRVKNPKVSFYKDFSSFLLNVREEHVFHDDTEIFVMGGSQIYKEVINNYRTLCKKLYITLIESNYDCDLFFPDINLYNYIEVEDIDEWMGAKNLGQSVEYALSLYKPRFPNEWSGEMQYLNLMKKILEYGETKPNRTGIDTKSLFGEKMEFNLINEIPILTTKKVFHRMILKELLFFISGKTNSNLLVEQGVKIWIGNTTREFLDNRGLKNYDIGDMGPLYGFQWRYYGAEYRGMNEDYTGQGIDQLALLIDGLIKDPHSRRHIISAWNVSYLDKMVLAQCHTMFQFNVSGDGKWLDCQLYQRSADMFLGVPFNITSYAMLVYMVGYITGLRPRKFVHTFGDLHIYSNHIEQVKEQLSRIPYEFPQLEFKNMENIKTIDDFKLNNIEIKNYQFHPYIKADMAV